MFSHASLYRAVELVPGTETCARMFERRQILNWLAGVHVALCGKRLANAQSGEKLAREHHETIVIGAGIAGLAAARALQNQGRKVFVLEARDRIGGRIFTSSEWPSVPLDLGASWIHGLIGNPLTKLAREAKIKLVETSYDENRIYNSDGEQLNNREEEQLNALHTEVRRALRKAQDAQDDLSIREVIDALEKALKLTPEKKPLLNFIINSTIEQEYAGSAESISAHWYDSSKEFDGEDALLPGGFKQVIDFLAQGLAIRTRKVVTRIEWSKTPVVVITDSHEYTAEKVLITLPLGVLKSKRIAFSPELPPEKNASISSLEMGVLNKCFLQFPKIFWPDDVDWLEYISQEHGEWTEWVSFARTLKLPVLLGFNAGDRGRELESWTDAEIVESAMETLRTMFGEQIPEPLGYQITRWASDPFSLGSYSFNAVGSHPKMRQRLAKPIKNRLFFAGEATEQDYFGTAHGAYLSGIRAAQEIMKN